MGKAFALRGLMPFGNPQLRTAPAAAELAATAKQASQAVSKIGCQALSTSSNAFASFRSGVSKPSVNQP
jgi:hypothetical protein